MKDSGFYIHMIMLTRSPERIFISMRYTGIIVFHLEHFLRRPIWTKFQSRLDDFRIRTRAEVMNGSLPLLSLGLSYYFVAIESFALILNYENMKKKIFLIWFYFLFDFEILFFRSSFV